VVISDVADARWIPLAQRSAVQGILVAQQRQVEKSEGYQRKAHRALGLRSCKSLDSLLADVNNSAGLENISAASRKALDAKPQPSCRWNYRLPPADALNAKHGLSGKSTNGARAGSVAKRGAPTRTWVIAIRAQILGLCLRAISEHHLVAAISGLAEIRIAAGAAAPSIVAPAGGGCR
jgi:hypothetical protein